MEALMVGLISLLACLALVSAGNPIGEINHAPFQKWRNSIKCYENQTLSSCPTISQTGHLEVTDGPSYCSGCKNSTLAVLRCLDIVLHPRKFKFYSKATTNDVRKALDTGCSTGNFTISVGYAHS